MSVSDCSNWYERGPWRATHHPDSRPRTNTTYLIRRLLHHNDRAVHLALLRCRQRRPSVCRAHRRTHPMPHKEPQQEQLLPVRWQWRSAQRARIRHALRPQLRHASRTKRVATRQGGGVARRLQAYEALMGLERRLGEPNLLREGGGREAVGGACFLVGGSPVLLVVVTAVAVVSCDGGGGGVPALA